MKTANRRRTPASNNRAHADLDDSLKRKLQNPEFRAAYDAEDKRIHLVLEISGSNHTEREQIVLKMTVTSAQSLMQSLIKQLNDAETARLKEAKA